MGTSVDRRMVPKVTGLAFTGKSSPETMVKYHLSYMGTLVHFDSIEWFLEVISYIGFYKPSIFGYRLIHHAIQSTGS